MPFLLPALGAIGSFFAANAPAIGAAASVAGTGASIGLDIANSSGAPKDLTTPAPVTAPTAPAGPTAPSAPQITAAANTQAATGGGASPAYLQSLLEGNNLAPNTDVLNALRGYTSA